MLIFPRPNKTFHVDGFREELADAGLVTEIFMYEDRVEMPDLDESHRDQVIALAQAHVARPPREERARIQTLEAMRTAISDMENVAGSFASLTAAQRWEAVRRLILVVARILRYLMNEMREE